MSIDNISTAKTSIFHNWDEFGADDTKFARQAYNEAIKEILNQVGGFPEVILS